MTHKFITLHLTIIVLLTSQCILAQNSFITKFNSSVSEGGGNFIQNAKNNYVGIVTKGEYASDSKRRYMYNLNEYGDTTFKREFKKVDSTLLIKSFIQSNANPIEYLVTGQLYAGDEPILPVISYFTKIDEYFNTIWEKTYQLHPTGVYTYSEFFPNLLHKKDGGYLFATNLSEPGDEKLILFDLSEQGDSLKYKMYEGDSAGVTLRCLTYNHDSTAYYIDTWLAHYIPYENDGAQRITVDFDLKQTEVNYYPRWFDDGLTSKLLPDGTMVTGGLFENLEPPLPAESTMTAFKFDTNFNQLAQCNVSDPDFDIRKDNGRNSLDFYYPNSIYIAGTFDYVAGVWIPRPSWIVIGKMDSDLNLLTEKYIGGDAYYHLGNIAATSDGGLLLATTRYDYLTQDHEIDLYVVKLDSIDLTVGVPEKENKKLVDAIIYPNPAVDYLFVRTAISNADFTLYDITGNVIKRCPLTGLISKVLIEDIPSGTYIWKVSQQSTLIETGKFIKSN